MRFRKIIAGLASAALAVSAMASSVFADIEISLGVMTQYNAVIEAGISDTIEDTASLNGQMNFGVSGNDYDHIEHIKVDLSYIDSEGSAKTVTKEENSYSCSFTVASEPGITDSSDITNIPADGLNYQAKVTINLHSYNKPYDNVDSSVYRLFVNNKVFENAAKITAKENTTANVGVSAFMFDASKWTVANRNELKKCDTAEITLYLNKPAASDNSIITVTNINTEKVYSQTVVKGQDSATVVLPMTEFYNSEYDTFEQHTYSVAFIAGEGEDSSISITHGKMIFKTAPTPPKPDLEEGHHAYIAVQTGTYSFRNGWSDAMYGKDTPYFNSLIVWGNGDAPEDTYPDQAEYFDSDIDGYVMPAKYTDVVITKDGTYTVSAETDYWNLNPAETMNLIQVSTDFPVDGSVTISDVKLFVDGKEVTNMPKAITEGDPYMTINAANAWDTEVPEYTGGVPEKTLSIQFTVSGLGNGEEPEASETTTAAPVISNPVVVTESTEASETTETPEATGSDNPSDVPENTTSDTTALPPIEDNVSDIIASAGEEDVVTLPPEQSEIPAAAVEELKGTDKTLSVSFSNGVTVSINGKDVTAALDINLDIVTGSSLNINGGVTVSAGQNIAPEILPESAAPMTAVMSFELKQHGSYGANVNFTIPVGDEYEGKTLTVYRLTDGVLQPISSGTVKDGALTVTRDNASFYVIAIEEEQAPAGDGAGNASKGDNPSTGVGISVATIAVLAVSGTVCAVVRKRKNK